MIIIILICFLTYLYFSLFFLLDRLFAGAHGVQQQPQVHQELGYCAQVWMHQEMLLTERCDYPIAYSKQCQLRC